MKLMSALGLVGLLMSNPANDVKSRLETRVFPRMALYNPGKPPVFTVFAEIKGEESEEFYCPSVEWSVGEGVDRLISEEVSDCPPFEKRNHWVYNQNRVCAPYIIDGEAHFPVLEIPYCRPKEPFGYPTRWSKRYYGFGPGAYKICVSLKKDDNVFSKSCVQIRS